MRLSAGRYKAAHTQLHANATWLTLYGRRTNLEGVPTMARTAGSGSSIRRYGDQEVCLVGVLICELDWRVNFVKFLPGRVSGL